ncbi:hypothetical protein QQ045_023087 [Rhodiola kirilowii]
MRGWRAKRTAALLVGGFGCSDKKVCRARYMPQNPFIIATKTVSCLAFNPFNENVVATASADKTVKLFDLRRFGTALYTLNFHKEELLQVGWNTKHETILSSCCGGSRVMVWDVSRIGAQQTAKRCPYRVALYSRWSH